MVIDIPRILRHTLTPRWQVRRAFPAAALKAIEAAVRESELSHEGEIRFAVEGGWTFLTCCAASRPGSGRWSCFPACGCGTPRATAAC